MKEQSDKIRLEPDSTHDLCDTEVSFKPRSITGRVIIISQITFLPATSKAFSIRMALVAYDKFL